MLVQSIAQTVALFVLRARGERTPYRMWLFPVPAVIALVGWVYVFVSAGRNAIAYGLVTVAVGAVVYLVRAGLAREWPFMVVPGGGQTNR
ncbi:MAG: hypothetical protein JOZ86_09665 [Candidatus Eremiobacteraeota bacterium]|nr:hypothetical protein [Candidatus Eremiobacteraeota bacterium]